jgi:hypothetical protein
LGVFHCIPVCFAYHYRSKCMSHVKILGVRRARWSKFHTQDPHILGAIIQNSVTRVTWICAPLLEGLKEQSWNFDFYALSWDIRKWLWLFVNGCNCKSPLLLWWNF